jgi:anion-transporting  ArsA/GET3 family ATPase
MKIVFCGKGGVGKSTVSKIYAEKLSKDKKTLIISIDQDHSLSIIFNKNIGNKITQIKENLYAIEIDAKTIAKNYINDVKKSISEFLSKKAFEEFENYSKFLLDSSIALNTAIIYGIYKIPKNFEIFIIDTPPSYQFISFLRTLFNLRKNLEIILKVYENWKNISENWANKKLKSYEKLKEKEIIANEVEEFFKSANYYIVLNPNKLVINLSLNLKFFLENLNLNFSGFIMNKYNGKDFNLKNIVDKIDEII